MNNKQLIGTYQIFAYPERSDLIDTMGAVQSGRLRVGHKYLVMDYNSMAGRMNPATGLPSQARVCLATESGGWYVGINSLQLGIKRNLPDWF